MHPQCDSREKTVFVVAMSRVVMSTMMTARVSRGAVARRRARETRSSRVRAAESSRDVGDESDDAYITRELSVPLATRAMEMVSSNAVVGLSRGEHASEVARMLSEALRAGRVDNVVVVPTEPLAAKSARCVDWRCERSMR